jgi:xanthine/uracil permease
MLEFLIGVAIGYLIALAIGYFEIMRKEKKDV